MAITAKDVQTLREMTGVGMMDCKKALTEAEGNMDKAVEILREKGLAASQKKAGRIAAEGMAYATVVNGVGVVVEVNAETDFVGKNEKFVDFVKGVAAVVAANKPADLDALMALSYGNGRTVQEEQQEMVLVIGENIKVRRFAFFTDGISVPYVHAGGKIGVLVNLETGLTAEQVETVGKDVAMQIAALNPRFWDKSQVDQATLDEEKKILLVQMENDPKMASKPEKVKEGIVAGKLGKFYKENCLLQQEFVKDNAMTVEQYIASVAKTLGGTITFKNAVRFEKGEGIENRRTSPKRSLSSWASKPQIGFERRTLSVRRFSMPARSPAPASGGPRRMARTSVLPEAKPWIGADSFRPNRMKIGAPRPASRVGRNFAGEIAKQLGK